MLISRFLYDAGGDNGGGGAPAFDIATLPADIQEKLKDYDSLVTFKQQILEKEPEKTPEQLQKDAELDKVNFRKFSVERDLMKDEDFNTFESVKSKSDKDLIFSGFAKQYKEDHPEIEDDKIEEETKTAFDNQYHLNSTDKTLKTRGEKLLAKEASELRTPLENSYKTAKERYDDDKSMRAKHPEYVKFFQELTKETLPDKITLFKTKEGEEEIPIEVDLTEEDKKAVEEKFFKNPKTFQKFLSGKTDEVKTSLVAKINSFIRERKMEEGFTKAWTKAHGIGVTKGSDIGATQPFSVVKGGNGYQDVEVTKSAIKEAIDSTRRKTGS